VVVRWVATTIRELALAAGEIPAVIALKVPARFLLQTLFQWLRLVLLCAFASLRWKLFLIFPVRCET
jgi:hypothetical protein